MLASISPKANHQDESERPTRVPREGEREGIGEGRLGNKCLHGSEAKTKIRHKKNEGILGKKNSSSLALSQMQSRDFYIPTCEGRIGSLEGGAYAPPASQEAFLNPIGLFCQMGF